MKNQITFSQAVEGYMLSVRAGHLSAHTVKDYLTTYRKFESFLVDDLPIAEIKPEHIRAFLAEQTVSKKTILNYHVGLSSLWTWALREELVTEHIVRKVRRPKPEKKAIKPYSEAEVRAMLNSLRYSRTYHRPGKKETSHKLQYEERNRAIILLLLEPLLGLTMH